MRLLSKEAGLKSQYIVLATSLGYYVTIQFKVLLQVFQNKVRPLKTLLIMLKMLTVQEDITEQTKTPSNLHIYFIKS